MWQYLPNLGSLTSLDSSLPKRSKFPRFKGLGPMAEFGTGDNGPVLGHIDVRKGCQRVPLVGEDQGVPRLKGRGSPESTLEAKVLLG